MKAKFDKIMANFVDENSNQIKKSENNIGASQT